MKCDDYKKVLFFWFQEIDSNLWFAKDKEFDLEIKQRFLPLYLKARDGELFLWRKTIYGRLAEIILLDQFPRNMFRGHKEAFATDCQALILSQEALNYSEDVKQLSQDEIRFLLMPWMHSESKQIHKVTIELFQKYQLDKPLKYEKKHKEIIDRFNRYPHRNKILNRKSTEDEIKFLESFIEF
ncbi:DUF924 family protein [Ignavigranum ruoffiae]|uniref:DUF924 family protein n=1 Tax=Ignavigranum ruoffiae TaxID=89093 RepID=UPI0024AD69D9|nr:DUF924 family protein [Ignavigranum ruoffiae]